MNHYFSSANDNGFVDLRSAVIVCSSRHPELLRYATILKRQVERRSPQASWTVTQLDNFENTTQSITGFASANVILMCYSMVVEAEREGYSIETISHEQQWLHIRVAVSSGSFALPAIYRLLRELCLSKNSVLCPLMEKNIVSSQPAPFITFHALLPQSPSNNNRSTNRLIQCVDI